MTGRTTLEEVTRVVYLAESGVKMCPSCETLLAQEYDYCPACGDFVAAHCETCRRRLDPRWAFCPFCGDNSSRGDAPADAAGGEAAGEPASGAAGESRRRAGRLRLEKRERTPLRRAS